LKNETNNLLQELNKNQKNIIDFVLYYKYRKNKNRYNRETIEKHKNCNDCIKHKEIPNKFFSFIINDKLINLLGKKGCEDVLIYDYKRCCNAMQVIIIKILKYICHHHPSKSILWYRNYISKKK